MNARALLIVALAVAAWFAPGASFAHVETGEVTGLLSGFRHPIGGLDHILAMFAVGLWGAQLGAPAIWILPVTFPLVMAFGGFLGLIGIPVPGVEIGIALSAVVLGLAVLTQFRPPLWVAMLMVGVFAIFHGHAHGVEIPAGASDLAYSIGFVVATGLLHAAGIVVGLLYAWGAGRLLVRAAGSAVALGGVAFLTGVL
jgi:urease accessory protein